MQKMQWTWWMLIRILRNLLKDFIEFCHFNIPGECLRGFREIFYRIPGNVLEDSGECLKRFLGVFRKIPENVKTKFREMVENISINVTKDSKECYLRFLKLCFFYQISTKHWGNLSDGNSFYKAPYNLSPELNCFTFFSLSSFVLG